MTDDHMWMVVGKDSGYVYVYTFDRNQFILHQAIFDEASIVTSVALTNDHIMLAISTYLKVYVYQYNGTKFIKKQEISFEYSSFRRVSWTEDHQYLSLGGEFEYNAYIYNNTGGSYQLI